VIVTLMVNDQQSKTVMVTLLVNDQQLKISQNPSSEEVQTIQWPKEKGQTTIYKTLHRKPKIEQH
jgi:hypothetical protein